MSQATTTPIPEDWRRVVDPEDAAHFRAEGWWRDVTGLDELLRAVQRHPHKAAVVCYRKGDPLPTVVTYGQLGTMIDRFAGAFVKLGVEPGDVVTIQLPNTWEFPALVFGAMRAGAVPNPVPHIYRERELSFMLRHARSKVYIVQSEFRRFSYRDLGLRLKPSLPHLEHLVTIGGPATGDSIDFTDFFLRPLHEHDDGLRQELETRRPGPDDPAFLMFTSGTTGQPKAALHSHNTAWSAGRPLPEALRLAADDVCFMASTVGHLTGFFWGTYLPLSTGQKVVYQDEWDPRGLVDIIDREGITWTLSATPFAMDMIEAQKAQPRPLSSFRAFACGGAPIPPSAATAMQEHLGVDLVSLWGMTEVGICSIHELGSPLETLAASDGMQVPFMGLRIVDDDLRPVPDGTEGRLQARGPSIILGYRDQAELTTDAQTPDGWFETGDLGKRMPDGGIRITGRSKDIIVRGGQNVPVVEIENLLAQHGKVRDVAVVAYPDERLGERGCAVVVPEGAPPTLRELTQHLEAAGMAKQFWPERLEIRQSMPRTPSGKIQKYILRGEVARP
ncbi:AMP-binding protein [Phytohabitans sp. ZYX-F-186]|uniref:AMP-binding protein n=1 Tax=Phytohabitans maris TaxID=3071409 RepID=A0ABU0ZM40_9ACTN|nr:AMP-binding protein [Phytohabitans sp. ZYX-F-186]MDQ7907472.1 AMP-binding protein [Phytohabitans sp. ZYX-F-186]